MERNYVTVTVCIGKAASDVSSASDLQDGGAGMEVSARRSVTSPGRPLCVGGVYGRSSPVSLCSLRGSPGALDSDVYWPAQLCCVWLQDLELTTNDPTITRTVARFSQAPAQDPLVCSSTRQCWLQLWVSCTVVPSALL